MLEKHFGTTITVLMTTYAAIHISDQYFSFIPGSDEEKKQLTKERLKSESKTLGTWDGFWTFCHPLTTEQKDAKREDVKKE